MKNVNGRHKQSDPIDSIKLNPDQPELEAFRQAAIEWAKASEATRVFLILEPLAALTDLEPQPDEYYKRMREAFEKETACRERYFRAVQDVLEARRKSTNLLA